MSEKNSSSQFDVAVPLASTGVIGVGLARTTVGAVVWIVLVVVEVTSVVVVVCVVSVANSVLVVVSVAVTLIYAVLVTVIGFSMQIQADRALAEGRLVSLL